MHAVYPLPSFWGLGLRDAVLWPVSVVASSSFLLCFSPSASASSLPVLVRASAYQRHKASAKHSNFSHILLYILSFLQARLARPETSSFPLSPFLFFCFCVSYNASLVCAIEQETTLFLCRAWWVKAGFSCITSCFVDYIVNWLQEITFVS